MQEDKSNTKGADQRAVVSFRADAETSRAISKLEKVKNLSKTDVITKAVKVAFFELLVEEALKSVDSSVRKVFPGSKIHSHIPIIFPGTDDEIEIKLNEISVGFLLPEFRGEGKIEPKLVKGVLILKISNRDGELKFELIAPLVHDSIDKVGSALLKNIHETASKNMLVVESQNFDKNTVMIEYILKGDWDNSGDNKRLENRLKKLKTGLEDLQKLRSSYS